MPEVLEARRTILAQPSRKTIAREAPTSPATPLWMWPLSGLYWAAWPEILQPLAETAFPNLVWRGDRNRREIALTFDDGPDPEFTPQVLEALRQHGVIATFFLVGERARRYPELVEAIRRDGHQVGSHSDSWRFSVNIHDDAFRADVLRAEKTLDLRSVRPRLFRPAGGVIRGSQHKILNGLGYTTVLATNIPFDAFGASASWITSLTTRAMCNGAILALHDSGGDRSETVRALPGIFAAAERKGLAFRTVSDVAGRDAQEQ